MDHDQSVRAIKNLLQTWMERGVFEPGTMEYVTQRWNEVEGAWRTGNRAKLDEAVNRFSSLFLRVR